jgi:hypothetical protein
VKPKTDDVVEAQDEGTLERIEAQLLERHLADEDAYLAAEYRERQAEWEASDHYDQQPGEPGRDHGGHSDRPNATPVRTDA